MISQKQANQLRISLLRQQVVISLKELKTKGPKIIMDQIHYAISEDEYENQDEITNIRYAQLTQMDQPSYRSNNFLSTQQSKKIQQQENTIHFFQRQGSKPRSNTPRRRSNFTDKAQSEKVFDDKPTEIIDSKDNKRKKTIKKSQTQEEQTISLLYEASPKYNYGNNKLNNLKNIVHFYIEDADNENFSQKQGNLMNYKVRQVSHEEVTCQFQYLTNLKISFKRASKFKKEVIKMNQINFNIIAILTAEKSIKILITLRF